MGGRRVHKTHLLPYDPADVVFTSNTLEVAVNKMVLPFDEFADNDTSISSATDEVSENLKIYEIILLNISYLGTNLIYLLISVEVLPAQIDVAVGKKAKSLVLGLIAFFGALVTFFTGPLIGMVSDRLMTPFGRRRPIIVAATCMVSLGLVGMAFSIPDVNSDALTPNHTLNDCYTDLSVRRCRPYMNNMTLEDFIKRNDYEAPSSMELVQISGSIWAYVLSYLVMIASYVCLITPYNALVADRSRMEQRGLNSGVMGFMILIGNLSGAGMGLLVAPWGVVLVYVASIVVLVFCVSLTVLGVGERYRSHSAQNILPLSCTEMLHGYYQPLKDHDFRWVFITRFLMQMGLTSVIGFLQYWLSDMVVLPSCWTPILGISLLLLPLLVIAACSSVFFGYLSDQMRLRKGIVRIASSIMCLVALSLALIRGSSAYYIVFGVSMFFGAAYGAYQAVDFALLMDILPDPYEKSRDIAVWQQALILPQALALPFGGIVVFVLQSVNCNLGLGYIVLWIITALYFLFSGIFVSKIQHSY